MKALHIARSGSIAASAGEYTPPTPTDYLTEVLADSPLLVWMMADTGGTYADSSGNARTGTYSGATPGSGSPIGDYLSYDGTGDYGSGAVNLSSLNVVTLEFWLWWNSYANDSKIAFEFTPNYNSANGFAVVPNDDGGVFGVGVHGDGFRVGSITRPSAAAWHHYSIIFRRNSTLPEVMVDGEVKTVSNRYSDSTTSGNFANSNLYVMARNLTSSVGAGRLAGVALFGSALDNTRRLAHYAAS